MNMRYERYERLISRKDSSAHDWAGSLSHAGPEAVLLAAAERFSGRIAFASSFGIEDQVITAMIAKVGLSIPIFTLDTGRLFPETHDLIAKTAHTYALPIRVFSPDTVEVEQMVALHGVNLFLDSVADRRRCCEVRKLYPLRRALSGLDAWVCGLRQGQSLDRASIDVVEWDEVNELIKINPLASWDVERVREYAAEHSVPYSPLHDRGFPSIGCAPCTRAVGPDEDERAGRWSWERDENRECGLHSQAGDSGKGSS